MSRASAICTTREYQADQLPINLDPVIASVDLGVPPANLAEQLIHAVLGPALCFLGECRPDQLVQQMWVSLVEPQELGVLFRFKEVVVRIPEQTIRSWGILEVFRVGVIEYSLVCESPAKSD
jgi:hypothetical protein